MRGGRFIDGCTGRHWRGCLGGSFRLSVMEVYELESGVIRDLSRDGGS